MQIEQLPIDKLILDPNNARKHDEKNLSAIKGSLAKFNQQKPIVIDKNNVVLAGNGTLEAARQLGWDKIACVRSNLDNITEKTAYALADNRSSELAAWDDDILGQQIQSLHEDDFDIGEIGFDLPNLDEKKEEGSDDQEKSGDLYKCPQCGYESDPA